MDTFGQGDSRPPRLNLFALPSRTTLLFFLIIVVIYVPLLATFFSPSPVCAPFLLFWMVVLPLWHLMRNPDRQIERQQLVAAGQNESLLSQTVAQTAQVAQVQVPRVLVSKIETNSVMAFGTFRRSYLAFSGAMVHEMQRLLETRGRSIIQAHAIILHELAHWRHNDIWLASLAHSILVVTIGFMTLNLFVHWLTPLLYYQFLTFYDFTQSPFAEIIAFLAQQNGEILQALDPANPLVAERWTDYRIAIFSSFTPLIVGSVFLLIFFWRALLRSRELYADARAVEWQNGDAEALWEGLAIATTVQSLQFNPKKWTGVRRRWGIALRFGEKQDRVRWRMWFATHPDSQQRRAILDAPHKVFGDDKSIALVAGTAVVLMNLNLLSLFYSATLRGPNTVPAFGLGFTIISLSLLPFLCQYRGALRALWGKIARIVLIFTGIKLIPQVIGSALLVYVAVIDPTPLQQALEAMVGSDLPAGFANDLTGLLIENFVIRPGILFALFMPAFLAAYLFLDLWIKRKILSWYGFEPLARQSAFVFAYSTAILAMALIFVLLPVVDWITLPTAHDLFDPVVLLPLVVVSALVIGHIFGFLVLDRRFGKICPRCKSRVESRYALGMHCEHCSAVLDEWLLANHSWSTSSK